MREGLIDYIESHHNIQDEISEKALCDPLGAHANKDAGDNE